MVANEVRIQVYRVNLHLQNDLEELISQEILQNVLTTYNNFLFFPPPLIH